MIAAIVVALACLASIVSVVLNPAMRASLSFLPQDATPTSIVIPTVGVPTVNVPTVDLSVLTAKPPTVNAPRIETPTPSAPRTPQGGKAYLPIVYRSAKP